jgi:hypothetical protein
LSAVGQHKPATKSYQEKSPKNARAKFNRDPRVMLDPDRYVNNRAGGHRAGHRALKPLPWIFFGWLLQPQSKMQRTAERKKAQNFAGFSNSAFFSSSAALRVCSAVERNAIRIRLV